MAYFRCVGSVKDTITLTLTVHGAKGDNIGIYDENLDIIGSAIFDADATSKLISIEIHPNKEYAFISTVAKATDGSTLNYSKSVLLDKNTTDVYVMPDNALYWYGNECGAEWVQGATTNNAIAITKNLNNISFVANSGYGYKQLVYNKPINIGDYSKLNSVTTRYTGGNYADFDFMLSNSVSEMYSTYLGNAPISANPELKQIDIAAQTGVKYITIYLNRDSVSNNGSLIAMWLE